MAASAGIVLAGGRSTRMGSPKAALEWHGSTLLRRITGIVGRAVDGPVVVVRAPGQTLPALPDGVEVVEDAREGRGPLQGLAAGLAAVRDRAPAAYASSTDVPLLHPGSSGASSTRSATTPTSSCRRSAASRSRSPPSTGPTWSTPSSASSRRTGMRPAFLFEACRVRRLGAADLLADPALAALDPDLESVLNLNEPGDYEAARGRPAPEITVRVFGALRRAAGAGGRPRARVGRDTGRGRRRDRPDARRARRRGAERRSDHARPRGAARRGRRRRVPRRGRRRLSAARAFRTLSVWRRTPLPAATSAAPSSSTSRTRVARRCPCPMTSSARTSAARASARGSCTSSPRPASTRSGPRRRSRSASRRSSARR